MAKRVSKSAGSKTATKMVKIGGPARRKPRPPNPAAVVITGVTATGAGTMRTVTVTATVVLATNELRQSVQLTVERSGTITAGPISMAPSGTGGTGFTATVTLTAGQTYAFVVTLNYDLSVTGLSKSDTRSHAVT